ncbi:MAG: phosphoketolase [Hydrogenophilaceae bacterium]|nr:phosphoketolase [Hydrogenophilaceae bacterium]
MSAQPNPASPAYPAYLDGIDYFGPAWPEFDTLGTTPVIGESQIAIGDATDPCAAYQTLLTADALRYLTLQITGSKASGHPGGFASSAEAVAALTLLGHKNLTTEVGHHAPGYYSAMFLDTSLEAMGISSVRQMRERFRERHGLLGHLSGAIPGLLAPAGPLGQGQHFAMAGAYLHRDRLFPVTIGDGGMGEPYVLSSFLHFITAYPEVTNFLPVLVWNGYSQEHHSMVSMFDNEGMTRYWRAHGFQRVILVDARDFDDQDQPGAYVDSTLFSFEQRMAFASTVLQKVNEAAMSAMSGTPTAFIIKQLKGAGAHRNGAKAHNLYPADTLDAPHIKDALERRALAPEAWELVRTLCMRAGGGPAAKVAVTESELMLAPIDNLPIRAFNLGEKVVPSTALGNLIAAVGKTDPRLVVTNADGNEASGMANINEALKIRHPSEDALYHQKPEGQVYEPLNEDACAGFASALALFGSRSIWLSYESFAINGWPVFQTVAQAMAELRRKTPSAVCMFTAGALEQGRNGWTHQRPEIENYVTAQMKNGNVYALFPTDANVIQAAYEWALGSHNKGIAIFASKSALPILTTMELAREGVEKGAITLYETEGKGEADIVFAATGDMILMPIFEAKDALEKEGRRVRIVSVVNPRRLYRATDVAWETVSEPDNRFMSETDFHALFSGRSLLAISGGPSATLEPVLIRSHVTRRDMMSWKRGETTASPAEIMEFNGLSASGIASRARALLG